MKERRGRGHRFGVGSRAFDAQHMFVVSARMDLGIELTAIGHYADAECELLAGCSDTRTAVAGPNIDTVQCARSLAHLYAKWEQAMPGQGDASRAEEWSAKLTAADPLWP